MPLVSTTFSNTLPSGMHARWKAHGVAANGDTVTGLTDLSGNGRDLAKGGAGAAITYNASGPNSKGALTIPNTSMLACNTFTATGDPILTACTFYLVFKALSTHSPIFDGNTGGGNVWFKNATTSGVHELHSLTYGDGATLTFTRGANAPAHGYSVILGRGSTALGKGHYCLDWQSWCSTSFRAPKLTLSGNTVGKIEYCTTASGGSQSFVEAGWWPSMLSEYELGDVASYLCDEYALDRTCLDAATAVGCWGTSTTENGYPHRLYLNHLRALGIPVWNWGISGGTSTNAAAQETYVAAWASAQRQRGKKVVLVDFHGHNDPGPTLTQYQSASSPQANVRAIGTRHTVLSLSVWHNDASRKTGIDALNAWLTSSYSTRFDAFYDICAADTSLEPDADADEFGLYGDGTTTGSRVEFPTYWYDMVHHTVAGYDRIAERLLSTVTTELAAAPGPPVAGTASEVSHTATEVVLSCTASSGGYGSRTGQWERKEGAGAYANVSGATNLTSLSDSGLDPETTYTYRLKVSDSATDPFYVYSNEVEVTTDAEGGGGVNWSNLRFAPRRKRRRAPGGSFGIEWGGP